MLDDGFEEAKLLAPSILTVFINYLTKIVYQKIEESILRGNMNHLSDLYLKVMVLKMLYMRISD